MDENEEEPPTQNARFRFGIRTLLWVMAVLSVAMALLGPGWGLFLGAVVLAHLYWWAHRKSRSRMATYLQSLLIGSVIFGFLLLTVSHTSPDVRREESRSHLGSLAYMVQVHLRAYGIFPPPYSKDANGQTLHSWRTLLLPAIGVKSIYDGIQFDEAWDSPTNKQFLERLEIPSFLLYALGPQIASRHKTDTVETHYMAIVDKETVWSPDQPITLDDISDGAANTIILIEVTGRKIPWYEPHDLTLDEAIDLLTSKGGTDEWIRPGYFVSERLYRDGFDDRLVAYADGHVGTIPHYSLDRETARALLTRSGGENLEDIDDRLIYSDTRTGASKVIGHIVHWGRIWGTAVFIVLAVGPFFVRKNHRSEPFRHGGEVF